MQEDHGAITITHNGKSYSGRFYTIRDIIVVSHHGATRSAESIGGTAYGMACQLLLEIIVRERRGVPDPEESHPDLDKPA